MVANRLIKVFASGTYSAKLIILVKNQQYLQANHHVCTMEKTKECGAVDVSRLWD